MVQRQGLLGWGLAGGGPPPWATAWKGGGQRSSEDLAAPGPGRESAFPGKRLPAERDPGCVHSPTPRRQRRDPEIAAVPASVCGACFTPTPTGPPGSGSSTSPGGLLGGLRWPREGDRAQAEPARWVSSSAAADGGPQTRSA